MNEIVTAADVVLDTDGLDPTRAARVLARRAAQLGTDRSPVMAGLSVMVWALGEERFAVPLLDIAAVIAAGRTTPVPGAPPALIGLASRRGRLVNVVDPAPALGLAKRRSEEGHWLLLRGTSPKLALRVDRAEGVMTLAADEAEPGEEMTRQAMLADGERLLLVNRRLLVEALGLASMQRGV